MTNIRGRDEEMAAVFRDELTALGIDETAPDDGGDIRGLTIVGVARLPEGFVARIQRRWNYFSVSLVPALPLAAALEVNHAPHRCCGTSYSGTGPALGAVARAYGHAGGLEDHELRTYQKGRGVDTWHCDSIGALATLLRTLPRVISAEGITADAALLDEKRRWTDEILASAEKYLASGGQTDVSFEALRDALHEHRLALADDPRVVAFRAAHPRTVSR